MHVLQFLHNIYPTISSRFPSNFLIAIDTKMADTVAYYEIIHAAYKEMCSEIVRRTRHLPIPSMWLKPSPRINEASLSRLERLSPALRLIILCKLSHRDANSLSRTSTTFYRAHRYNISHTLRAAAALVQTVGLPFESRRWLVCDADIFDMCERDTRVAVLLLRHFIDWPPFTPTSQKSMIVPGGACIYCSKCVEMHREACFSTEQRASNPRERACLAAETLDMIHTAEIRFAVQFLSFEQTLFAGRSRFVLGLR